MVGGIGQEWLIWRNDYKNLREREKDSKNPFFHKSFIDNNSNGENPIHEYFYS